MAVEDIRVLIPRVRRAVEGVAAVSQLSDDQVKDLIADSLADVILFCAGVFGKTLVVLSVDPVTSAPTEYATSEPLTLAEGSVVAYQAAITQLFFALRDHKVAETIRDEGSEWSYTLSATLLRDQLKYLIGQRDQALTSVNATTVAYVSYLAERDHCASLIAEPWISGGY